jgi:uncharacterized membrane protein (DUF373 family)
MSLKDRIILWIEAAAIAAMQVLLIVTVVVATIELYVLFARTVLPEVVRIESPAGLLLTMQQSFAGVLTVVLGLELLETLKTYFTEHHVRLEVILVVAIIAVGRQIIQVDLEHTSPLVLFGLAAVILALCAGYFLVKRTHEIPEPLEGPGGSSSAGSITGDTITGRSESQ